MSQEAIKLHAARKVYRKVRSGNKTAPSGKPWKRWWEDKFGNGQSFDDYVREQSNDS